MRSLASSSSCPPPPPPPPAQDDLSSKESSLTSSMIAAMEAASDDDLESEQSTESRKTINEQLTLTSEEEECPYEQLRTQNVQEKQRQLELLGMNSVVESCKTKPKPRRTKISSTEPIRKSKRLAGMEAEADSMGL